MKDELLKILEIKLKYLTDNSEALNRMNANLEREKYEFLKFFSSFFRFKRKILYVGFRVVICGEI